MTFPYPGHRTMQQVMDDEYNHRPRAFYRMTKAEWNALSIVDKTNIAATLGADSAMQKASREGASNTAPGSDQLAEKERTAMASDTACNASAQAHRGRV